jgi:tRNA nucleotidyltransferase (CCA-adding enzyme)
VRFAVLASAAPDAAALPAWLERIRADGDSAQLARLLLETRAGLRAAATIDERARLLERSDALRRPARFAQLLQAQELLEGPQGIADWQRAANAFAAIDAGAVARGAGPDPGAIAQALAQARRAAIAAALSPSS